MAYTANDVITKFRARYGDCPTTTTAMPLLNEAAVEIFSAIPYRHKALAVNLTAGTSQYGFGATYAKVWSARYVRSSAVNDFVELEPTSTDALDDDFPGWRATPPSSPLSYYLAGDDLGNGQIGVYPPPNTSTSSGYPILALDVSTIPNFSLLSDPLPDMPFVLEALADLMCFKRAKDAKLEDASAWKAFADESFTRLAHVFWSRNPRQPQTLTPVIRQSKSWRGNSG